MPLEIHTTWPRLGMRTTPARLEINQPQGKLQIRSQKIKQVIDRRLPQVLIDQSQCFKELGCKNPVEMAEEAAALGRQRVLEYIGRLAEEGDYLGQIDYKRPAIAELAQARMEQNWAWNIAFLPQSRPQFEVTGHLRINWQVSAGKTDYQPQLPQFRFRPGKLEIYLRQHAQQEIHYLDEKV